MYEFQGVELDRSYTISLGCIFKKQEFDCGTVFVSTSPPDLVVRDSAGSVAVYRQQGVARDWAASRDVCVSGGGHLVSLASQEEEGGVTEAVDMPDFWTGGNMCPDSPGDETFIFNSLEM